MSYGMLKCVILVNESKLMVEYNAEKYGKRRVKYSNSMDMETEINRFLYEFAKMGTHKIAVERRL